MNLVLKKTIQILQDVTGNTYIAGDTLLKTGVTYLDSLDIIEGIMCLEDEFRIDIEDEAIFTFQDVTALAVYIELQLPISQKATS